MEQHRDMLINVFQTMNSRLNLSSFSDADQIYTRHILDSLEILKCLPFPPGSTCIDVGTGGGFPLLPLAIRCPQSLFVGLDARRKKVDAINEMIHTLGITNAKAIWGRAEDHPQKYDLVVARAVAYAKILLPRIGPLCKKHGIIGLYKQYSREEDADIHEWAVQQKMTVSCHHYTLPGLSGERCIYTLK